MNIKDGNEARMNPGSEATPRKGGKEGRDGDSEREGKTDGRGEEGGSTGR